MWSSNSELIWLVAKEIRGVGPPLVWGGSCEGIALGGLKFGTLHESEPSTTANLLKEKQAYLNTANILHVSFNLSSVSPNTLVRGEVERRGWMEIKEKNQKLNDSG